MLLTRLFPFLKERSALSGPFPASLTENNRKIIRMEVKVTVEGVPLVVSRVTEETTCQEVVISLAQFLGRPGRYTLKEKFKEFERNMTPNERVLESLEKYGEQAREVQLTLLHNGPSLWEEPSSGKGGRYQPGPQLRRTDVGGKVRKGSSNLTSHRQSLPPLLRLRTQAEPLEEVKRPKRKSLTLIEEARGWLESLGRGAAKQTGHIKGNTKDTDKRDDSSQNVLVTIDKDCSTPGVETSAKSSEHQQTSGCMRDHGTDRQKSSFWGKENQDINKDASEINAEGQHLTSVPETIDETRLRLLIGQQQDSLNDLQAQINFTDANIHKILARQEEQEAQQKVIVAEDQLKFWENELMEEERYEKDLQKQFLEMKEKAVECKAKLEEYKRKMRGLDNPRDRRTIQEEQVTVPSKDAPSPVVSVWTRLNDAQNQLKSHTPVPRVVNTEKKSNPRENSNLPHAVVPPNQMKDSPLSGTCQSEALSPEKQTKTLHRSEIKIHLVGTRV